MGRVSHAARPRNSMNASASEVGRLPRGVAMPMTRHAGGSSGRVVSSMPQLSMMRRGMTDTPKPPFTIASVERSSLRT